ncbi:hypothetical protein SDC9_130177 [bioreactor metagenome]|uniref:Uncharacterized protein n=1 Tax=bioreactor metagenome TaxID=1076179 RepID=A0A645D1J5_9ZZZZ
MKENTNTEFSEGTFIEYLPSISVVVPVAVPLTRTFTPIRGSLVPSSNTVPCTIFACCISLGAFISTAFASGAVVAGDILSACTANDSIDNNAMQLLLFLKILIIL